MGKRTKGRGKRRKRRAAITRRDPEAKRARREAAEDERAAEASEEDQDDDGDSDDERDSDAGEDDGRDSDAGEDDERDSDAGEDDERDSDAGDGGDEPAEDDEPPESEVGSPDGAAWALPLVKLEHRWTWLETRLLFVALLALTFVLCLFFALRGMKEPLEAEAAAGTIWRAMVGAGVLGGAVRLATRNRGLKEQHRTIATVVAVILGLATAKLWRGVGIDYFTGVFDWLQEGSTITLMGGLKGISTRLTMTVALIGASLAAAVGGHINIDVVVRLIPPRVRKPVAILGSLVTTMVCLAASWGLFDHIAVAEYHVGAEKTAGQKVAAVKDDLGHQFFVWRKQAGFDLGAMPNVLTGKRWNAEDRMNGRQWNDWLAANGFDERYGKEKVDRIRAVESDLDMPRHPFVVVPEGEARGMLLRGMDLIFPLGFLMIGLRFLLRALLLIAGHINVKIEAEDDDDDVGAADPTPEEAS